VLNDQKAREQAIAPQHSYIVQAPAGSGKTELLTRRFLALLATVSAPEQIIAITFTRKAAAEMKQRIVDALQSATKPAPAKDSYQYETWALAANALQCNTEHQWNLLTNTNRLRIMTFDSLAATLCAQAPILSGFGAAPTLHDTPDQLYEKAVDAFILTLSEPSPWKNALENVLLHLDNRVSTVKQLLVNMLRCREQWLPHIVNAHGNKAQLRCLLEDSLHRIAQEKMERLASLISHHQASQLLSLAKHAAKNLQRLGKPSALSSCIDIDIQLQKEDITFDIWFAISHLLLTKTGTWRKSVDKRSGFPSDSTAKPEIKAVLAKLADNDVLLFAFQQIQSCPPHRYNDAQWQILLSLLELLPLLSAQLHLIFKQERSIDFIELNLAALQALGDVDDPTDLSLYLDYRLQHLLIDEFQDTSILQFDILERLTAGWEPGDGRSLFLVGDPMQSIYRFRNAEVGLFLRAQSEPIGHIQCIPLQLTCNFRSNDKLIHWINERFATIFPKQADMTTGAVNYSPSIAMKTQDESAVLFHPVFNDQSAQQAQWITKRITSLCKENPDDRIAILVRSRSHLVDLSFALQEANLPFQAVEIMQLTQYSVIQDIMTLARALLHRADRTAWLATLRAPWCGLTLNDLHILAQHAPHMTLWHTLSQFQTLALSTQAKQRLAHTIPVLSHCLFLMREHDFTQVCYSCWLNLGGADCVQDQNELEQVAIFFSALRQIEQKNPITSVEQIEQYISQLFAKPNQTQAQIHMMTIHKSKGLEFEHVFLPSLDKRANIDPHQLLLWLERPNLSGNIDLLLAPIKSSEHDHDPIYHYLRQTKQQQANHELARLFYVAVTRAKKTLTLTANIKVDVEKSEIKKPTANSFLSFLFSHYKEEINQSTALSQSNHISSESSEPTSCSLYRLPSNWTPKHSTPPFHIPSIGLENTIQPEETDIKAQVIGTLIHQSLEAISIHSATHWQANEFKWRQFIITHLGKQEDPNPIIQKVTDAIELTLKDEFGQWILQAHPEAQSEYAITTLHHNKPKQLIIDRTFIDEKNRRWIIDYKTATPPDDNLNAFLQTQKQHHHPQLERYAHTLSQMDSRPILLCLYFPLIATHITYEYKECYTQKKQPYGETHA